MPTKLPPPPLNVPLVGINNILHPMWSDWIQKSFIRMGGKTAESNDELYIITADRIPENAITSDKIAASVAGEGLTGGGGVALGVSADGSTLEVVSDQVRIKDLGVSTSKIAAEAVSFIKLLQTDWTSSKSSTGYQKLPNGLYIQWGVTASVASGSSSTVTFPQAFPNACLQVIAGLRDNSGSATTATGQWGTGAYAAANFAIYNRTSVANVFNWMAVGH